LARFLAIDWEQQQVHVVQASTVRGGVRIEQALTWGFPEPLTAVAAEGLGKKLREALKEANVAPAPVLACIGRERMILKELRYPAVAPSEEPAIVRFQAAKELTESMEDAVVDYTPMGNGAEKGERHTLAVIVRKEVVNSLQGLCRGMGMKLLAITPRPAAVIGALDRSRQGKVPVGVVEALLTIGPRWADLSILRGQTLLFARSLGVGPTLAGEVKRSLTVFNTCSENPVQTLFVASDGEETALCAKLQELLGLPVQFLDSFLPGDAVRVDKERRGRFTAGIGLLQRWSEKPVLGINFVCPKEPKPVESPRKRQKVLAGIIGALLLLFLVVFGNIVLAGKKEQLQDLNGQKNELDTRLKSMSQEILDINALKDWDNTTISWINELYDFTARFPSHKGFRINSMTASPSSKKNNKDKYAASVFITGVAAKEDNTLVHQFVMEINKSGKLQANLVGSKESGQTQEFQVKVDLAHQALDKYTLKIPLPTKQGQAGWKEEASDSEGDNP